MPFRARNPYCLRISEKVILPLYVFLDERHLQWMSDRTLHFVLADLRPLILPKLRLEASYIGGSVPANSAKKPTVDVHKSDEYQFCFFFQSTEPHSILIKTRNFVATTPQKSPPKPVSSTSKLLPRKGKRKNSQKGQTENSQKKRRTKAKDGEVDLEIVSGTDIEETAPAPTLAQRRSGRFRKPGPSKSTFEGRENDIESTDSGSDFQMSEDDGALNAKHPGDAPPSLKDESMTSEGPVKSVFEMAEEDEELKPKPTLQLKYQGFRVYGHCLCVVVEPTPHSNPTRAMTVAPPINTEPVLPGQRETNQIERSVPLFLPDLDESLDLQQSGLIPMDTHEGSEPEDFGMMQFSQILNAGGEFRPGIAEDDDEMDGAVFFGDADEIREM